MNAAFLVAQVLFLLYHYYEAREIYNAIRIFIAGYVWMTGFGNFSYYYKTGNYSFSRLSFLVLWMKNLSSRLSLFFSQRLLIRVQYLPTAAAASLHLVTLQAHHADLYNPDTNFCKPLTFLEITPGKPISS